ncbi:S-layer protein [Methanoregula sp.]|uniref:COG1361 S-layer family protein n=1 Tax=Methanoregula sp. TaxID=2052170 RepID=UPI0023762102|nr:S-layer protein [Methanoregula sp.]MDD1686770.1 S-layer protein [Methanoregula sp.]
MASTSLSSNACTAFAVIVLIICGAAIMAPVSAATKYLGGTPVLSASVTGVNEFTPGQDATISILVKNTGVSTMKQLDLGTIDYEDLPTTAKFVTVSLASPTDDIIIKSDPQMIGTIPASGTGVAVQFKAKISANATTGEYPLPLTINYKYSNDLRQEKADVYDYVYVDAEDTIPVTIRIKPEVKIAIVKSDPDTIATGTEGYLRLTIQNIGPEDGSMATVKLVRIGSSAIIPTDSTVFIGNFPSGGIANCSFKISASTDATNQIYPVNVLVTYTNREGQIINTDTETIGIPVNAKTSFSITSPVPSIAAGTLSKVDVTYRNNGNLTVFDAQSRLTPHGLVTLDNNVEYLGTIRPGESVTARYDIQVDKAAETGEYTFDSKLRYRDVLGNSQESDTIPVTIQILPAKGDSIAGLPISTIVVGIIIVGIIAGIGLFAYRRKKSMQ